MGSMRDKLVSMLKRIGVDIQVHPFKLVSILLAIMTVTGAIPALYFHFSIVHDSKIIYTQDKKINYFETNSTIQELQNDLNNDSKTISFLEQEINSSKTNNTQLRNQLSSLQNQYDEIMTILSMGNISNIFNENSINLNYQQTFSKNFKFDYSGYVVITMTSSQSFSLTFTTSTFPITPVTFSGSKNTKYVYTIPVVGKLNSGANYGFSLEDTGTTLGLIGDSSTSSVSISYTN